MIALRDVTKTFGARVAVDHVSLALEPDTTRILLGSSGSGKSTILRLVLGLLPPDTGEVLVHHAVREAFVFGSTITLLNEGRVVQEGTFADLAKRPADPYVAEFLRAQTPPAAMTAAL